jgi:parallel beta-helix repeat protein
MKSVKIILFTCLLVFEGPGFSAQNLINQYDENNLVASNFDPYEGSGSYYWGEFQVFFDNLYMYFENVPSLEQYEMSYRIECLSVPFQTPEWSEIRSYSRWLLTPDQSTLVVSESNSNELLSNLSHQSFGDNEESRIYSDYHGTIGGNDTYSNYSTERSTIVSQLYTSDVESTYEIFAEDRVFLPHSILRVTLNFSCDDEVVYSIPFLVDLTRGMLRKYPFCDNFQGGSIVQVYDLQIRPRLVLDPIGHFYDDLSNLDFYPAEGEGTVNYFDFNSDLYDLENGPNCFLSLFPQDISEQALGEYIVPPPYSILDAVVLNNDKSAFAGYIISEGEMVPLVESGNSFYTDEMPWQFYLDKPFDWHSINPNERVVYMPSELVIGKPIDTGVEIPIEFEGVQTTLPSGYTFATVLGAYPSRTDIEQMISNGECSSWRDCFPETDVEWSKVYVEEGSVLNIEDCVRLYDLEIHVKQGGILNYDPTRVVGRYNVFDEGGTINEISPDNGFLFCNSECGNIANYDFSSLEIEELGSLTIDMDLSVLGDIVVNEGATLEITSGVTLFMGPDAKIIVKNGGVFECQGATITSACDKMWRGIEMWDMESDQENLLDPVLSISNSTIRNAHIAVLDGRTQIVGEIESDDEFLWYSHGFANTSWGSSIELINNVFTDCGIGVYHPNYIDFFPSEAQIILKGNLFQTSENGLPDLRYNSYHEDSYPNIVYPWFGKGNSETRMTYGVILSAAKNVIVGGDLQGEGNNFENVEVGVRQVRSSCDVVGNSFENLQYGIHINQSGHFWNTEVKTRIKNNTFNHIFDPSPGELSELLIPAIDPPSGPLEAGVAYTEIANSACVRIEGMKQLDISLNDFGVEVLVNSIVTLGIYLENCSGLEVNGNDFYANKIGIVLWDLDNIDWGGSLIGPIEDTDDKNEFENCDANIKMGGRNLDLLIRCSLFENGSNYTEGNWFNIGQLGNQGYNPEDSNDDHAAAGNEFTPFGSKKLLSYCFDDCSYYDWNTDEFVDYEGWSYYHHAIQNEDDEKFIPTGDNLDNIGFIGPIEAYYNESTSCNSPYEIVDDGDVLVSFIDISSKLIEEKQLLAIKKMELDNYNSSTQILLNAIYGGISDQYELKEFLRVNSPLSNTVLRAYMERYDVPASYFLQIIEANGELDQSLHQLLEIRIENMPAVIGDQIKDIVLSNPYHESYADLEQRVKAIEKAYRYALIQEFNGKLALEDHSGAQLLLDEFEGINASVLSFDMWLRAGNYSNAHSAFVEITNADNGSLHLIQEREIALSLLETDRGLGQLSIEERGVIGDLLFSDPKEENYTEAKSYMTLFGEFPMYIPILELSELRNSINEVKPLISAPLVYPNPAANLIRIEMSMLSSKLAVFRLYDVSGREVLRESFNSFNEPALIELVGLSSGIYAFDIEYDSTVFSGKLLKK